MISTAETLEYELPLDIVKYPSSLLRQENLYIQHFDHKLSQLARGMFDVMYATEGIGLAAPQVGVNVRLMVYNPKGSPNESTESVLVNPRIVRRSSETCWMEEGCLSFPDIFADVEVRISSHFLSRIHISLLSSHICICAPALHMLGHYIHAR